MTWRQLLARRPRWWSSLAARVRGMMGASSGDDEAGTPHRRSSDERAHFWAEFRAGQREADRRAGQDRKIATPCPENGTAK
jgi:hypothetical protein